MCRLLMIRFKELKCSSSNTIAEVIQYPGTARYTMFLAQPRKDGAIEMIDGVDKS